MWISVLRTGPKVKQYRMGARSTFYFHTGAKNVTLYGVADAL